MQDPRPLPLGQTSQASVGTSADEDWNEWPAAENSPRAASTQDQANTKKRRGSQARSACVVCARGKRKCEGGRPCERCLRVDKADACLAGIPYEQGICRKRRVTKQTGMVPQKSSRSTDPSPPASSCLRRDSLDEHGQPKTYHNGFKYLSIIGGVTTEQGDSVCSARLCSMMKHENVFSGSFASFRRLSRTLPCSEGGSFQLCRSRISLLGCLAADEWNKNDESSRSNFCREDALQETYLPSTCLSESRWSSRISLQASCTKFQLCRPGDFCRYSSETFKSFTNEVSKERLCMEALASLIADGFSFGDIEKMAVASLCSSWGSGQKAEPKKEGSSSSLNANHEDSALDGMLMLSAQSLPASVQHSSWSNPTAKSEYGGSTITMRESSSVGDVDPNEQEFVVPQETVHNNFIQSQWRFPHQTASHTGKDHLLRLAKRIPLDSYIELPTVPLMSITFAVDNFPPPVSRVLSKVRKHCTTETQSCAIAKVRNPELAESLSSWYKNFADEQMSIGVPGLALERLLRSMFNTPHTERIPMYDDLMGIIAHQFPYPLTHIENDMDEGVANRIWINDAMLEMLNVEPKGIAAACGMKLDSQGHGGIKLVRGPVDDDAEPNLWMHPQILLPRAMATTQAQLLKSSLFAFKGKYLRNVEHQEQCNGAQPYTVFRAREILHCVRHNDGPLLSITQTFLNPEMDSSSTLEENMVPQGGLMMRKLLRSNHRPE